MPEEISRPKDISLVDFLPEFFEAFTEHITEAQERWGNEWLGRPILANEDWDGQNERIYQRFDDYWEYLEIGAIDDIPWLKVIGNAFIATVRLNHPEYFPNGDVLPEEEVSE